VKHTRAAARRLRRQVKSTAKLDKNATARELSFAQVQSVVLAKQGFDVSGEVILITGALSGIGRATAIAFAREGARVVVSGRRSEEGKSLSEQLRSAGTEAEYFGADVRQEDDVKSLIDFTVERFGRLDVAVNSAGFEGRPGPLIDQSAENYRATFETNILGTFLAVKHELAAMRVLKRGSVVNLSSTMGHKAAAGMSLYAASKHAVEGLTKAAALEAAAFGVRVNAIAPGATDTDMLARLTRDPGRLAAFVAAAPLGRLATPDEIADAILFLASDRASFITGQVLSVDGGKSAT
jgi:NAD(P)-dependent dehydrogenase (short-subunit alcohol dehydrogenase family)